MRVSPLWFLIRAVILGGVTLLFLTVVSAAFGLRSVHAGASPAQGQATSYPAGNETAYPIATYINGMYPVGTETLVATSTAAVATPEVTLTPTSTSTLEPNAFLTENAEMGKGKGTPPAGETPGPTITAYVSPTAEDTPTATASASQKKKSGALPINWGLFWIGFSLPVLAGCGVVLYLLDRRPDLFRPRPQK